MILFLGTTPAVQRAMHFERVTVDDVNRATRVVVEAAGKSVNAARVAHTLGASTVATGFLGGDSGELVRRSLDAQGVRHDFVTVAPATRVCVTVVDRQQNQVTELVEEHAAVAPGDYAALLDRVKHHAGTCDVGLLSGSLPPGAPVDFYARCMELARSARWVVDASGEPLRHALSLRPFVVKPNARELSDTVGLPVDTDDELRGAIRKLLASGPTWAVVTRGARPVVVSDGAVFFQIIPPHVESVSPIGAGDAFAGALATALFRGQPMDLACAYATSVAAASTLRLLAGEVDLTDAARILPNVRVEPM